MIYVILRISQYVSLHTGSVVTIFRKLYVNNPTMKKSPFLYSKLLNRLSNLMHTGFILITITLAFSTWSCEENEVTKTDDPSAVFLSFVANGQTLPTAIHTEERTIRFEVDHDVDVASLHPEFKIPDGYSVYVNGQKQESGTSTVDFTKPVTYVLRDKNNQSTTWNVEAIPLTCKILIDASHDGGVWWYPQGTGTGFDPNQWHQGQPFAEMLRSKGFEVTELGRDVELTEELFFGHYIVIRANGFEPYTAKELEVYTKLIERGINLVFFTDHKKNDPTDELGDHLGINFKGAANGTITKFGEHEITANMNSLNYIAGSAILSNDINPDMVILGWLGEDDFTDLNYNNVKDADEPVGSAVMGVLNYPKSRIFFIGDMNGIEIQPQPFINNLITWMGSCPFY